MRSSDVLRVVWDLRRAGDAAARVRAAHPDSLVLPTALVAADLPRRALRRVAAVVADRDALSFRDRDGGEALRVAAASILSLELGPMIPGSAVRAARVEHLDGPAVEFWAGATPDQQLDTIVALRTALGRPIG